MSKRNFYIRESEMDDFQRKVLDRRSDSSLIVRGCAGSGKSVIAFWRLHDIVSNNRGSAQIIVFTKSLKDYFVEGCRGAGIDPGLIDYWHNWKSNPRRTDYILVDEAQDFSEKSIKKFSSYAIKALLLYGDSSQQLYGFRRDDPPINMDEIQRVTEFPVEQLVFNHRLPKTIARVAECVNAEKDDLVNRCKHEGDEKPYVLKYSSFDEQLDAIIRIIEQRQLDDVGILFPKNDQVRDAARILNEKNLEVEAKYNANDQQDYNNLNFATTNPKVMTYHSAKGLQFGAVFLPACDSLNLERFCEPFYVALTRSYQSLYVLYSGHLPGIFQEMPQELYESDLSGRKTEVL